MMSQGEKMIWAVAFISLVEYGGIIHDGVCEEGTKYASDIITSLRELRKKQKEQPNNLVPDHQRRLYQMLLGNS